MLSYDDTARHAGLPHSWRQRFFSCLQHDAWAADSTTSIRAWNARKQKSGGKICDATFWKFARQAADQLALTRYRTGNCQSITARIRRFSPTSRRGFVRFSPDGATINSSRDPKHCRSSHHCRISADAGARTRSIIWPGMTWTGNASCVQFER